MAKPKSSSTPKSNRPGNKFFVIVILIGVIALMVIWWMDKSSRPARKVESKPAPILEQTRSIPAPTQVLVMTQTNLPANKLSNVVSVITAQPPAPSQIQTQAQAQPQIQTSAPPILRTNQVVPKPVAISGVAARPVQSVFETQLALARQGISAGSIDGVIGSQTRAALQAFQLRERLPLTGELDVATKSKLFLTGPSYGEFLVTANDLARLQPLGTNWWTKSKQDHLGYETALEMVAEKSRCSPTFLKQLNPSVNWTNVTAGIKLRVPVVEIPKPNATASFIRISLAAKNLKAFDAQTNLLAHFPCSIAQKVEKRPIGALYVETIATDPDYTFNPDNFPESAEARSLKTKLILSPGPNNPVGSVWIGLSKPGYGIHGTPKPEDVGRTESHGCFRLANWNAEYLVRLVSIGTPIFVEP